MRYYPLEKTDDKVKFVVVCDDVNEMTSFMLVMKLNYDLKCCLNGKKK